MVQNRYTLPYQKELYMTNEELAKHWNISQEEVNRISKFINTNYKLDVVPVTDDSLEMWQGILYAYDPQNKYILMESKEKYASHDQAVLHWTRQIQNMEITPGQAKLMDVPVDAFRTIKPVNGYERVLEQTTSPVILNKFSKRQKG